MKTRIFESTPQKFKKLWITLDESYWKMKRSPDKRAHKEWWDISTLTEVFVNQRRVNVCEHTVKNVPSLLCVQKYYPPLIDKNLSKYQKVSSFSLCSFMYYSDRRVSELIFLLWKPGGLQWSTLTWDNLESSYAYINFFPPFNSVSWLKASFEWCV
jgi:hypothetical protein